MVVGEISPLVQSQNTLLYPREDVEQDYPNFVRIREGIERLLERLRRAGPFFARGPIGPYSYKDEPILFEERVGGREIYGWRTEARRELNWTHGLHCVLILGARKMSEREDVYFTNASEGMICPGGGTTCWTDDSDRRVYVTAHAQFARCSVNQNHSRVRPKIYLSCLASCHLTTGQERYVRQLGEMELESIVDGGEGQARCRTLGQRIFEEYTRDRSVDSFSTGVVYRIVEALQSLPDGTLRRQYVCRAWKGIGNELWSF